jgi:uncharacterized protein (DUF433 family)
MVSMNATQLRNSNGALGLGFYTGIQATRLLRFQPGEQQANGTVSIGTVRRVLRGYHFRYRGRKRFSPPLWQMDFPSDEGPLELSFRDLIELRFVKIFRDAGLGLPTIRTCFERAREFIADERPFSTRRFRTDGNSIFLEITKDIAEGELIDLKRRQYVFRRVVAPSLHDLEFEAESVARWFPLGEARRAIVIDPKRAHGQPLVDAFGVTTASLARAFKAEGALKEVARLFGVPGPVVRQAVEFENKLAAA